MITINANSLKWAYKKLKNYVYYSSPASYLKDKIIDFENNYDEDTFSNMAQELLALFSNKCDMLKGQRISYTIFPKKDGIIAEDNSLIVENFNVFIDMPLKFFLVDILFTLNIFENLSYRPSDYSFGNDFDKRLWQIKEGDLEGDILENNLLFANFNSQYDLWKDRIYSILDETNTRDKLIIKMDFKKSYYNVYFNINKFIQNYLNNGILYNPIYEFEKNLYRYYSAILERIIPSDIKRKKNYVHLPIGLFSSACIFNILLKDFDEIILNKCIAYSRYVDDILIVLPQETKGDLNAIFGKFFPDIFLFNEVENEYEVKDVLNENGRYIINKNKIKVLSYKCGYPLGNLKAKLNKMIKPSLDVIEEMDFEDDDFDEDFLYKHDYLKRILQTISFRTDEKYDFIRKLSDADLVNLYSCWKVLLANAEDSSHFIERIKNAIKISQLINGSSESNEKLKRALSSELKYASESLPFEEHLLCDIKQDRIFEHIEKIDKNQSDLFFPLTSTFDEITLYQSQKQDYIEEDFIPKAQSLYKKINGISINKLCEISQNGDNIYHLRNSNCSEVGNGKVRIAVANMNLLYDDLKTNDIISEFPTTYKLSDIKYLIDCAKNADAEVILFPEFSLPEKFAVDIVKYCRKKDISIITGLTHRKFRGKLVNQILIRDKDLDLSLFKWKNYLPVEEKKFCLEHGYGYLEPNKPYYFIVNNGRFIYSTMTCFEATSIKDRALLCDLIEILYMPVFNRDTFYFSNIVSSFVRDASCFIAQSNSNLYGDSRISGPYGQVFLDVVKLKGGLNNYFVVGEIDLNELRSQINAGKELEDLMNESSCSVSPKWNQELNKRICGSKDFSAKPKPISAGYERFKNRQDNGIDIK